MKYDFEKLMQEYDKLLEKKRILEEKVKTRAKKLVPYIAKKYAKNTPYFNRCVKVGEIRPIKNFGCCYAIEFNG